MSTDNQDSNTGALPGTSADHPINADVVTGAPAAPALDAAPAKPKRTRAAKTKTVADDAKAKAGEVKPKRPSTRKAGSQAPSVTTPGPDAGAPPLTVEAMGFLANQDAKAADMFALSADSQKFVAYHFKHMQQMEADSAQTNAYLLSQVRPVAPAYQQFVDALRKQRVAMAAPDGAKQTADPAAPRVNVHAIHGAQPGLPSAVDIVNANWDQKWEQFENGYWAVGGKDLHGLGATREAAALDFLRAVRDGAGELPKDAIHLLNAPTVDQADVQSSRPASLPGPNYLEGATPFYGVKASTIALPAPQAVALGKMDIAQGTQAEPTLPAKASAEDRTRASIAGATAHLLASVPIDDVTKQEAAEMVADDVTALSGIKDRDMRLQALEAIGESAAAQPRYKAELERQAPELAAAVEKDKQAAVENTIEPGPAIKWKDLPAQVPAQPAPAAEASSRAGADPLPEPGVGKRLLRFIGGATLKAGTWMAEQGKEGPAPGHTAPVSLAKPAAAAPAPVMPEAVARRFVKVEQDYYFPDKTHAFSDRGNKLATRAHHPEVVRALVDVAKARGWDSITVKGTEEFRRGAWMEAAQRGLKVSGYQPTAIELAELSQRPAVNSVTPGAKEKATSAPKANPEQLAMAKAFDEQKPAFVVKKYPGLAGAYGMVEAAKAFAAEKLPEDARDEFVGMARRHVMQKIMAGQQINGPKIYLAAAKAKEGPEQPKGEGTEVGKPPRAREHAREK